MKGNIGQLMKQAQQMQENMRRMQEQLGTLEVEGQSGAGMVKVQMTCKHEVKRVSIDPSLVAEIHRQSGGRVREIMNAIATVEQTSKRNGKTTASLQDMAGMVLTHDWQARRPRMVASPKGGR